MITTSRDGLNFAISVSWTIPIPPVNIPGYGTSFTVPAIPGLSKALKWLGDHAAEVLALILKLISMIPEASIRLEVYVKTLSVSTKVLDEVLTA